MNLWTDIINSPTDLANSYDELWTSQQGREKDFYNNIREKFNKTHRSDYFLYLLSRCVKAAIRYNNNGEFNQSPDNRRLGTHPDKMRKRLLELSHLLKGRSYLSDVDYKEILCTAKSEDIIYMDPPYQGVCENHDTRYICDIPFKQFIEVLQQLNDRKISFILSYDGKNDLKKYGKPLPDSLELTRIELYAGRSTQATLLGHKAYTIESLYISSALYNRLGELPISTSLATTYLHQQLRFADGENRIPERVQGTLGSSYK